MTNNSAKSWALLSFLCESAHESGCGEHVYAVGGCVRNFVLGYPVKDIDIVVDSVNLGKDSSWVAQQVVASIPVKTHVTINQYGVVIISIKQDWLLDGHNMVGEVIEIANARKESYDTSDGVLAGKGKGKGYKPTDVQPATIQEDVYRREFTFNTLLWRFSDIRESGPSEDAILDITGVGLSHLQEKVIHTPLNADRTFSDDPTRMLRAIKFMKYDLTFSDEVYTSIKKNAHKLKNMPWEAVAIILVRDILLTPNFGKYLVLMQELGLLQILVEMSREEKAFAAYLAGQFQTGDHEVQLLLDLAKLELCVKPLAFLHGTQRERLQTIVNSYSNFEAKVFLDCLRRPHVNSEDLIAEFFLVGRECQQIVNFAREALLETPRLVIPSPELNFVVREKLTNKALVTCK